MTEKAKKEIIITSVLVVVMVVMVIRGVGQVKKYKRPASAKPAQAAVAQAASALGKEKKTIAAKKKDFAQAQKAKDAFDKIYGEVRDMKVSRDPFALVTGEAGEGISPSDLSLYGIIWDEKKPVAIINDEMVSIGDTIGKSKVVTIEKDSVTVNDGTRDFKLLLN